jgi:hypothetical protein
VARRRHNRTNGGKGSYAGYFIGLLALGIAVVVGESFRRPEWIRPLGYVLGMSTGVVYTFRSSWGKRPWFWPTLLLVSFAEFGALTRFESFSRVSAKVAMPIGLAIGVLDLIVLFAVGLLFEPGWRKKPVKAQLHDS